MALVGAEASPLFLSVPEALPLKLVSLFPLPAPVFVALAPTHIIMGVKVNAFTTPCLTKSTGAKEEFSNLTEDCGAKGPPRGLCTTVQGLPLSSRCPFPLPPSFVDKQAKFPSYFI